MSDLSFSISENRSSVTDLSVSVRRGCQVGFFDAKFGKFGFFHKQLASRKTFWLFLINIWLFLEAVGTYYQAGVLA